MPFIRGGIAGLFHRLFISPRIGTLMHKTQSVATPTAGVILSFMPMLLSILSMKKHAGTRDHSSLFVIAYSYLATFLGYGGAVVVTILAGIGGKKE